MQGLSKLIGIFLIFLLLATALSASAQSTAFAYQGRLLDGGSPASGAYDLEFRLFDAVSGGNQVGSTQSFSGVSVANGVFAVQLDFGANFPGAERFLETRVRMQGQTSFTTLVPRKPVSSSPYAIKSLSSASADNASQLGGTAASQYVQTGDSRLTDSRPPTAGSNNYIQNTTTEQAGASFDIGGTGRVGGTLTATDIRIGSSGQYHAIAGEESFRVIRGIVGGVLAEIEAGTGFTTSVLPFGDRVTVTYSTPFSGTPTVVVTPRGDPKTFAVIRPPTSALPLTHGFSVSIYLDTGTGTHTTPFNFIVIGPR